MVRPSKPRNLDAYFESVKQPLVPSSDNDMPVENAKKPKPRPKGHGAKQVTATGAKGQATFTTYDANATTALKGRSEKQSKYSW